MTPRYYARWCIIRLDSSAWIIHQPRAACRRCAVAEQGCPILAKSSLTSPIS